jgi:hypothetical protein
MHVVVVDILTRGSREAPGPHVPHVLDGVDSPKTGVSVLSDSTHQRLLFLTPKT